MKSNFEEKFEQLKKQSVAEQSVVFEAQKMLFSYPNSTQLVELPSRGKFYPPDSPLYNVENIEIREMTAKEEDILTNKSYIKKGIIVDKLLESIIVDKNISVQNILIGDKNAIMIAARENAYGPTYDIFTNCLNCGKKNNITVDLSEVKKTYAVDLPGDESDDVVRKTVAGDVSIVLPKTKWIVTCKMMNGEDEQKIFKIVEEKRLRNEVADMSILEQLNIIIKEINFTDDKEILKTALDNMPASDAKFLRDKYYSVVPNISIDKRYICSSCTEEQEVEVPFTEEFFWPK